MNTPPATNTIEIIGLIAGIIGTLTGTSALIWNITNSLRFCLEIYHHNLSCYYEKRASHFAEKIKGVDLSNYSENAIEIKGWIKLLLRRNGLLYKNHHVDGFFIELKGELKDLLTKISATPIPLDLSLFCKDDVKDLKLPEGLPIEVVVKSNPIHLKKDWKTIVNNSAKIEEKVNELMEKNKLP